MSNLEKKKRIRWKKGQVFQVPLGDGTFVYGQSTEYSNVFFDYRDKGENPDLEEIIKKSVMFRIGFFERIIKDGIWKVLGILPVKPEFEVSEDGFGWDPFNKRYFIFKNGVGQVPATLEEIQGLELMASWDYGSVEQRLRDHFAGRPNWDVEEAKNRHNPNFIRDPKEFYKQYGYDFTLLDDE